MKYIIVAYDQNRVIGANNQLLWQGSLPADMHHFRDSTSGQVVIMGRKTYESIGRPLPNRQNIVVTHQPLEIEGVSVVHSLDEAYGVADADKDIYVIGGGQIYRQALDSVDVVQATEIKARFEGGDTYFPNLPDGWSEIERKHHEADDTNKYAYDFVTFTKPQ